MWCDAPRASKITPSTNAPPRPHTGHNRLNGHSPRLAVPRLPLRQIAAQRRHNQKTLLARKYQEPKPSAHCHMSEKNVTAIPARRERTGSEEPEMFSSLMFRRNHPHHGDLGLPMSAQTVCETTPLFGESNRHREARLSSTGAPKIVEDIKDTRSTQHCLQAHGTISRLHKSIDPQPISTGRASWDWRTKHSNSDDRGSSANTASDNFIVSPAQNVMR